MDTNVIYSDDCMGAVRGHTAGLPINIDSAQFPLPLSPCSVKGGKRWFVQPTLFVEE